MLEIGQSARKYRWKFRWEYTTMTPELAYLIGVYLGDGSIVANKQSLWFVLQAIDQEFVEYTRSLCQKLVNETVPEVHRYVYSSKNSSPVYKFVFSSGDFASWMMNITACKTRIPREIDRTPGNPILKEFLSGFLDSDGFICNNRRKSGRDNWNVGFGGIYAWIHEVADILRNEKCVVNGPWLIKRKKYYYDYRITPKSYAQHGVDFKIHRKQEKLKQLRETKLNGNPPETVCHAPTKGEETVQQLEKSN